MAKSTNPFTGEILSNYAEHSDNEVDRIIKTVDEAQPAWAAKHIDSRANVIRQVAHVLLQQKEELAEMSTNEMGKPITQGIAEVEKCAAVCIYYAQHAEEFLKNETIILDDAQAQIIYQPLGTILAVMPWNFPYWQVMRFAAPNLIAGNTVILKHASNVTGCAKQLIECFKAAGLPDTVFNLIVTPGSKVKDLVQRREIKAVTLTGSTQAGASIAEAAGKNLKKSVLELGGSDPYLILEDADIELAAQKCAQSRMINNGQSCIAAKRFIVHEAVYDSFTKAFIKEMSSYEMADPKLESTKLGPMASFELRDALHKQVQDSIQQGAKCLLGGSLPDKQGAFYPATVLAEIPADAPAASEELFGPVASLFKVPNTEAAITLANNSIFGLGGAVFSKDTDKAFKVACQINTGSVAINDFVKSNPKVPFGGINKSGYGRELGKHGILEFVNVKSIINNQI